MIPAGTYRARAVEGALGHTEGGNPQLAVQFTLLDDDVQGQTIAWYGYFTEKTQERTVQALRYCGWQGDDLTDLSGIDANEVQIVVDHEEYNGVTRAKVQWVNDGAGLRMKSRMSQGDAAAFAAKMRGAIVAQRQKGGGSPATGAKPGTTPASRTASQARGGTPPAGTRGPRTSAQREPEPPPGEYGGEAGFDDEIPF